MAAKKIKETENTKLEWLESAISIVDNHSMFKIIKAFVVLIMTGYLVFFATNPSYFFEKYDEYKNKAHEELMDKRDINTPLIQDKCDELLYTLKADRCLLLELHNNTNNIAGLPFKFASASCESLQDGITPVASQYAETKLSLLPFATHLFNEGYWTGKVEDIKAIDKSLYYKLMSNDAAQVSFIVVEGVNKPNGILMVSYLDPDVQLDPVFIKREMSKAATKIAVLLEGK